MTPNLAPNNAAGQTQMFPQRPGFLNGFGGSMIRGLLIGGLIGALLGHGFGSLAGMFGFLVQALLIAASIVLALRFRIAIGTQPSAAMSGVPRGLGSFGRNDTPQPSTDNVVFPHSGHRVWIWRDGSSQRFLDEITLTQTDPTHSSNG
jgi:predicted lipid-binding transport protein (Tim44 family)